MDLRRTIRLAAERATRPARAWSASATMAQPSSCMSTALSRARESVSHRYAASIVPFHFLNVRKARASVWRRQ
eukprot:scaffold121408_cov30-Tisochrysis_lutea.AAC.4